VPPPLRRELAVSLRDALARWRNSINPATAADRYC